jgi:tetratricopeptide (TPR) repeat protein
LELDPRNAKTHNNLGAALLRQGKFDQAMTHFQKALEFDPELSQAQGNWGIALFWEGKLDEAIPHFQKAVELNSENAKFYETFISGLNLPASLPQAGTKLEHAVHPEAEEGTFKNVSPQKLEKLNAQYRRSLNAVLAYIMGSDDPARRAVREEEVLNQSNRPDPQDVLRTPSASPDLAQPGRDRPGIEKLIEELDIPRLRRLAEQEKNPDESFLAQRQILLIFLHTFDASNILLAQKRNSQALTCLEIAAQAAPRNPYIEYDLARAQVLNGQSKKALKTLQLAMQKGFNDAEQVEGDRAFESLRPEADYQKALAKMRGGKPQTEPAP